MNTKVQVGIKIVSVLVVKHRSRKGRRWWPESGMSQILEGLHLFVQLRLGYKCENVLLR